MLVDVWFPNGFTVNGVLLSGTKSELRVAMEGWDDAAIFGAKGGDWVAENGDRVAIHPHRSNSTSEHQFFEMFVRSSPSCWSD
jgi:hypothetical protein